MNILIFCNCVTEKCLTLRNNEEYSETAGAKKILALSKIMENRGDKIDICSSSFSKNINLLFIENFTKNIRIIHSPTIGFFGKFSFFKKTTYIVSNIIWLLSHLKKYNLIVFYNFHVEYSLPAMFAKFIQFIKIASPCKIIMEYEDGLFLDKGYQSFWYLIWEKFIYKNISNYLLVNHGLKKRVEKYYPNDKNYQIINGFINDTLLNEYSNCQNKKGPIKKVLFSGNFSRGFGFEQLLLYIDNIDKNIQFFITGKASEQEVSDVLKKIQNLDHIKYYGFLKEKEFNKLIQTVDAFILLNDEKSKYNTTNFPSKFFDYLSRNKFIITSKNPILTAYYDMQNVILLKNFPNDIKYIETLSYDRETNYEEINFLSLKMKQLLENFISYFVL